MYVFSVSYTWHIVWIQRASSVSTITIAIVKMRLWCVFPGPVVDNLPCNAGGHGFNP